MRIGKRLLEGAGLLQLLLVLLVRSGWIEFGALAAVLVCAGGVMAFSEIVDEALEGDTHVFDEAVLLALRAPSDPSDPIGPRWLEIAVQDLTALGGYTVIGLIGLLAVGYLAVVRRWRMVALVTVSLLGGMVLNAALKNVFARPRPELVAHLVEVQTASLPSGHAMLSAVAYLTLGVLLARVQTSRPVKVYLLAVAVGLSVLVGFSRVYLGVHWPTDVLAGWCIGAAWAMACWLVARIAGLGLPTASEPPSGTPR